MRRRSESRSLRPAQAAIYSGQGPLAAQECQRVKDRRADGPSADSHPRRLGYLAKSDPSLFAKGLGGGLKGVMTPVRERCEALAKVLQEFEA